jgi:hypothetical protein
VTIDPIQGMNVAQVGEKLFADLSSMACSYATMYTNMTIDERVQVHFGER